MKKSNKKTFPSLWTTPLAQTHVDALNSIAEDGDTFALELCGAGLAKIKAFDINGDFLGYL